MRIDKYLWSIRVFKTRSKAAEACRKNKISIDDQIVKSSRDVKIKDVISVRKDQVTFQFEVLDVPKSRVGAKLVPDYSKNVTPDSELEKLEMIRYSKGLYRERGSGRPTKRDRRDLESYFEKDEDEWGKDIS